MRDITTINNYRRLLTVHEVAERLNLRESTIRMWLLKRRLPRVRCGRAVRVPAEAVERFIQENTISAREASNGR
jgi:excisionase family DNA binding protein